MAAILLTAAYLGIGKWQLMVDTPPWWLLGLYSLVRAYACVAICAVILEIGWRRCNASPSMLESLAANSYTIYILHLAPVLMLQSLLVPLALPPLCKAVLVCTGACTVSLVISCALHRNTRLAWACLIAGFGCLCVFAGG